MTKFPTLSSVSLRLHVSPRLLTWAVVYRTSQGREFFDRRVSSGTLNRPAALVGPAAVVAALEAACDELRARHGLPRREAVPGAPGGGGGAPTVTPEPPHLLHVVPDPETTH